MLLIYILRHAIQENLITDGVLLALQDKRLNTVLGAILQCPQEDWRIEQLADLSAMSRANFIRVFQQQLGMSPGRFYYSSAVTIGSIFIKTIPTIRTCHCFRGGVSIGGAF